MDIDNARSVGIDFGHDLPPKYQTIRDFIAKITGEVTDQMFKERKLEWNENWRNAWREMVILASQKLK